MTDVSVAMDTDGTEIGFTSDDQSFQLRQVDGWWTIDEVDDRGQRYSSTAKFSTFDLAEKYLVWNWASVTRSAIGAKQLGVQLHGLGMAANVELTPTELEGTVDLQTSDGSAIVSRSIATIFSHLMSKSVDEIEQMVREGVA